MVKMALLKSQRKQIRDYPCSYDPEKYTNMEGVFEDTNLKFPQVYRTAEGMIEVAREIARANGVEIIALPFCYTVELEAFGGDVNFGDERVGPRPGKYVLEDPRDFARLAEPRLDEGRIGELIRAVKILKAQGEKVCVSTSGAVAIMSGMMDLVPILKALRREKSYIKEALEMFKNFELKYYKALSDAGADIISMSELSMPNILGPEIAETIVKYYLHPFFKEVQPITASTLHMCPKSTYALIDTGYGSFVDLVLPEELGYGQGLMVATDKDHRLFGRRCIGNLKTKVGPRGIKSISLV